MAVAGDGHFESCGFRLQIEFCKVVEHIDADAGDLDHFRVGQLFGPFFLVDVAANGRKGRDRLQLLENLRSADITGMDDVPRSTQGFEGLRTKQAMRVGDDADEDGGSQFPVLNVSLCLRPISWFISA
jgi:hypothetical protein